MLEFVNRRGSDCYKWDSDNAVGTLPLWVADMDFKASPAIRRALARRLEHGVFGYSCTPAAYYEAVSRWFARRHGWEGIRREQLITVTGVVPAISAVLRAHRMLLDEQGRSDERLRVMTLTPAYNCFFSCISNLDAELVECRLVDHDGRFEIDFADFEKRLEGCDILLLCNPHNPTGRVWTRDELQMITAMCDVYGTFVVADEIHCEFTMPGHSYTPYATIAENDDYCVLTSASKAFNIAGLQCACIYVPDAETYGRIDRAVNIHEVGELNVFGTGATIAAYNESEQWLDEINSLIADNYGYLREFVKSELPSFRLTLMEGTYLAWLRLPKALALSATDLCDKLAKQEHVLFNPSEMYGAEGYIRINLATSTEVLAEALRRLADGYREISAGGARV